MVIHHLLQPSLLDDFPTRLRRAAISGVLLLVLGVLGYRIMAFVQPPPLVLASPQDQLSTSSRVITIHGTTAPGASLSINGRAFVPDAAGNFTTDLVLVPGVNTIELESRTTHSRPARVIRRIRVTSAEAPLAQRVDSR
ncbi:hypothetical protein HY480_01435 [Candidatus Uhrbacteria bacterium]|nr:hypothetical protein [Candidatus Uhrbacteria bacterium]